MKRVYVNEQWCLGCFSCIMVCPYGALMPNAYMQGEVAGNNMAGGEATFDKAIAMNSIGFFGLHLMTAGIYTSLIRNKTDLSTLDFRLISEEPLLMAFAKNERACKLGDVQ